MRWNNIIQEAALNILKKQTKTVSEIIWRYKRWSNSKKDYWIIIRLFYRNVFAMRTENLHIKQIPTILLLSGNAETNYPLGANHKIGNWWERFSSRSLCYFRNHGCSCQTVKPEICWNRYIDNQPVSVKIQKEDETLIEAVDRLLNASKIKQCSFMILFVEFPVRLFWINGIYFWHPLFGERSLFRGNSYTIIAQHSLVPFR